LELIGILFAIGYAVVTFFQWRDLRDNFMVQQRAWMKAGVDWSEFMTNSSLKVQISNTGKSPAFNIHEIALIEIVPKKNEPSFTWKVEGKSHLDDQFGFTFPGDSEPPSPLMFFVGVNIPRRLTPAESKTLSDGDSYAVAWGFITYRDSFGPHWTRFCSWKSFYPGNSEFNARSCVLWNSAGDGKSPDE
jgi:hypothetical protein